MRTFFRHIAGRFALLLALAAVVPLVAYGIVSILSLQRGTRQEVIQGVRRISKPGLRVYRPYDAFSKRGEAGAITIVSTPKGLLTDRQAFQAKVGGELLCLIW